MWTFDELVENYNKDKIINKIINYEYENSYRSSRSEIREFLGVNPDYYYYPHSYKYRSYNEYDDDNPIDIAWFSKLLNFEKYYYEELENMNLKLKIDNQEYNFDLSNYIEELKNKSDSYEWKAERKEIIWWPALVLEEENYKLVITWFSMNEEDGEFKFNNIRWYIMIR